MDMAHRVKTPLRRSFSEHVKDSTNKAWDIFWKSAREKRLSEIEAKETCDWLRAAGFPQYARLFKDCCFPVDMDWVKSDHEFLDNDALESLCRRLGTLNKYVEMKLDLSRFKRRDEVDQIEEPCAISPKWSYNQKSKHWIRADSVDFLPSVDNHVFGLRRSESCEASLSDSSEHNEILSCSTDSDGGGSTYKASEHPTCEAKFPNRSCSGTLFSGELYNFKQFPEKPPRKKGESLLRTMEKLKLRGSTSRPHDQRGKARLIISGPILQVGPEENQQELTYANIAGLRNKTIEPASCSFSGSSCSSSENSSTAGTPSPVTKVRSNYKRRDLPNKPKEHDHAGVQELHNQHNLNANTIFEIPHGHKPGTFPTTLSHAAVLAPINNTNVNWRTGSFHGYHGRRCQSSGSKDLDSQCGHLMGYEHRASIYDNVPDNLQITDDDVFSALDGVMEGIGGFQELVTNWAEKLSEDGDSDFSHTSSPSPSSLTDIHLVIKGPSEVDQTGLEQNYDKSSQTPLHTSQSEELPFWTPLYWFSEQICLQFCFTPRIEGQPASCVSMLQRLSLLRFTAVMDKHSPFAKEGWNWTVPKVYKKSKSSEQKSRKVFDVSLLQSVQRSGKPLPPSILRAMEYLKTECLDQVGLFRKPGVKSRIQYLRDMVEADPDGFSFEGQSAFDVADMLKQYFRDLPEPIFTSKLCESFLHIYQYFPKEKQFEAVQAIIFVLPDENREALQSLLFFLHEVVASVKENQMTPTNIAVCLAPSLFHLNVLKRDTASSRPGHRKYSLGRPDQKDLSENLAATQGLAHMVAECGRLFQMPLYWKEQNTCTFNEDAIIEEGLNSPTHSGEPEPANRSRLNLSIQQLLREAQEKNKDWVAYFTLDHVDVAFKKVEDGYPMPLWRGIVEVDAPHKEVFQCILKEHRRWQSDLQHCEVVETLDKNSEIYQYTLCAAGTRPPLQHLLLRTWQSDPSSGPLLVASTSVEHPEVPNTGLRAQVHCCMFLIEQMGPKKSRLTHFCQTDTRGRSVEWHHKVAGHLLASTLVAIKDACRVKPKD